MINNFIDTMTIWTPDLTDYAGPRYRALADAICDAIASGELAPDSKLPPQRRLADALAVTVGTVTRAYGLVEQRGKVEARVGSGTYVKSGREQPHYWSRERDNKIDLATCRAPMQPQVAMISEALQELAADHQGLATMADYRAERNPAIHDTFVGLLSKLSLRFEPSLMQLCYGGQHGVFSCLMAACRPGDLLAVDELVYPGVKLAAQSLGLRIVGVGMDDQGMVPDELASLCRQQKPRAIYLTPNNHNPTCNQMPLARQQAIVEICREHDLWIIEDDVNYALPDQRLAPLYNLAPERVCYVTSLSKCFAGGLRVGVLVAPADLNVAIQRAICANSWMAGPLVFELASRWLASGEFERVQQWLSVETRERQAMADELLQGVGLTSRHRGFNRWLTLPAHLPARAFANRLAAEDVNLRVVDDYAVTPAVAERNNAVRISVSAPRTRECLRLGLERIAAIYREMSQQFTGIL